MARSPGLWPACPSGNARRARQLRGARSGYLPLLCANTCSQSSQCALEKTKNPETRKECRGQWGPPVLPRAPNASREPCPQPDTLPSVAVVEPELKGASEPWAGDAGLGSARSRNRPLADPLPKNGGLALSGRWSQQPGWASPARPAAPTHVPSQPGDAEMCPRQRWGQGGERERDPPEMYFSFGGTSYSKRNVDFEFLRG